MYVRLLCKYVSDGVRMSICMHLQVYVYVYITVCVCMCVCLFCQARSILIKRNSQRTSRKVCVHVCVYAE